MKYKILIRRIGAHIIDAIVILIALSIVNAAGKFFIPLKIMFTAIFYLAVLLYFIILEEKTGQTVGKRIMCIRVISVEGKRITWKQSIIRNLLRAIDSLPFFYITGIICICISKKQQRIGDIAANTKVVQVE